MAAWIAGNWKWASVAGSLLFTGGAATYNHVEGADERMDAIEVVQEQIVEDVSDVRCMTVKTAQGEDPLGCIDR